MQGIDRLDMRVVGKILVVGIKVYTKTMIVIEHACHAVETETVEVIFRHPELEIGEQEVNDAGLAIVKALGAPRRMIALFTCMEELPLSAVEHVDALGCVLHRMGMHDVQQHADAQPVRLVDQILEVLRAAKPAGGSKETGHLITKASVIRMFHDGHQLHGVVSSFLDARTLRHSAIA